MSEAEKTLQTGDGLLVVDVQNDFCPGGELAVAEGDRIVPVLNTWIRAALGKDLPVYASRDWHPKNHVSFQGEGGPYPPHCLQDSSGAAFHPSLQLAPEVVIITKGTRFDQDQNSVFDQTGFNRRLLRDQVHRLWVGGLAEDICVLETVLEARDYRLDVRVLSEATRPASSQAGERARQTMRQAGAVLIH